MHSVLKKCLGVNGESLKDIAWIGYRLHCRNRNPKYKCSKKIKVSLPSMYHSGHPQSRTGIRIPLYQSILLLHYSCCPYLHSSRLLVTTTSTFQPDGRRKSEKESRIIPLGKKTDVVHMSSAYITLATVIVIQLYLAAQEVNKMECYLGTQIFYYYYKRREEQIWKIAVVYHK